MRQAMKYAPFPVVGALSARADAAMSRIGAAPDARRPAAGAPLSGREARRAAGG